MLLGHPPVVLQLHGMLWNVVRVVVFVRLTAPSSEASGTTAAPAVLAPPTERDEVIATSEGCRDLRRLVVPQHRKLRLRARLQLLDRGDQIGTTADLLA